MILQLGAKAKHNGSIWTIWLALISRSLIKSYKLGLGYSTSSFYRFLHWGLKFNWGFLSLMNRGIYTRTSSMLIYLSFINDQKDSGNFFKTFYFYLSPEEISFYTNTLSFWYKDSLPSWTDSISKNLLIFIKVKMKVDRLIIKENRWKI